MRRLLARLLLVVVDREPLVVRADEHVEEAPRPAGEEPELAPLALPQRLLAGLRGWLTQRAISGATSQSARSGAATRRADGSSHATSAAVATARTGDQAISRHKSARGDRAPSPNAVCAADVH